MAEGSIGFYAVSFFRSQFAISVTLGSLIIVVGNILGGCRRRCCRLIGQSGRSKTLGNSHLFGGSFTYFIVYFRADFSLSWGLSALRFWFSGMSFTAGGSLVIEQLPKFRGTMMSLNTTFMNLGMLLAAIAGGIAINIYNYQTLALILGGLGVAGTAVWVSLVRDPCKAQRRNSLTMKNK